MRPSVNVKVERGSTFTCTRDFPCSLCFIYERKMYVHVLVHVKTT